MKDAAKVGFGEKFIKFLNSNIRKRKSYELLKSHYVKLEKQYNKDGEHL